eukprot:CAMPEP_0178409870 /NCGR_PEP_ID=MMETSP0689_2-20121128/20684_1 /TAXON_ID=160604 /ORGANISM="Amphidinium massartii, Strain CS-259" /LENGTH=43 /DNA_ID= /DNA_START= /DNA_END= /DNA_ORIENTATION=
MKDTRPMRMLSIRQDGFQLSGWKSDMLRHSLVFTSNLPDGVIM